MTDIPPGDPDIIINWDYRLVLFGDGVRLIEVYYEDEERTRIAGWGLVSMDGDTPADLGFTLVEMHAACSKAAFGVVPVLEAKDLPETDPCTIFELEDSDYN